MENTADTIHALLVEDNLLDAELLSEYLGEATTPSFKITRVERLAEALNRIQTENFDIILLDLSLPDSHGLDTFVRVHSAARGTPIIVQSGLDDETTAIKSVQAGAQDYLVKGSAEPRVLIQSIRYAVERGKMERIKDEFIAVVGHELKTPLTSIYSSLDMLKDVLPDEIPESSRQLLDIAWKNCERLRLLIGDILDVERLETGNIRLGLQPVAIAPFLREALTDHYAYGRKFGVEFKIQGELPDIKVRADRHRLMQVAANLLSNAAKFSPPGSTVLVGAVRDGNQARVFVRDKGTGIPDAFRSSIFQKFAQADANHRRSSDGTGLGLNIARGIINSLGGDIGFESETGVGTEFWFSLREWNEELDSIASQPPPVLLLTHDPAFIRMVENMLKKDARVNTAENLGEAVRILEMESPAVIVLDGELPGETAHELHEKLHKRSIPMVLFGPEKMETRANFAAVLPRDLAPNPEFHEIVTGLLREHEAAPDARMETAEASPASGDGAGGRLLIAEDDPDIRALLEMVLEQPGDLEFLMVQNGREAADAVVEFAPDLVMLDVMMPVMNGPEALREIRRTPGLENLPVIFLTARGHAEIGSEANTYETISKPFKPADLLSRIRATLGRIQGDKVSHEGTRENMSRSFEKLRDQYLEKLPERARMIGENTARWLELADDTVAEQVYFETHKLGGTGAMYGFAQVSEAAQQLEQYLKNAEVRARTLGDPSARETIEALLNELKEHADGAANSYNQ